MATVSQLLLKITGEDRDAASALDRVSRRLSEFDREEGTATADVDATAAQTALDGAERSLESFDGLTAEARASIETAGAQAQIERLTQRLEALGRQEATPEVAIRTASTLAQLERVEAKLNAVGREKATIEVDANTRDAETQLDRLNVALGNTTHETQAFQSVLSLVKLPGKFAAAGIAAQAVGVLGAAVAGLGSVIAATGPALAGAGLAGLAAYAQAAGVAKLATMGLAGAFEGLGERLEQPTPAARAFGHVVERNMLTPILQLRNAAQAPILDALTNSVRTLAPMMSSLRPVVAGTAAAFAQLATRGTTILANSLGDIGSIGRTSTYVIGQLGNALLTLGVAFRDLLVVAGPFTRWLASSANAFAQMIQNAVAAGRASGALAENMEVARSILERLGSIAGNVGRMLAVIFSASLPLGQEFLKLIDEATARTARWFESAQGRNRVAEYFQAARGPMRELVGLAGDVVKAMGRLSEPTPVITQLIRQVRELIPIFEQVAATTAASFGPVLIESVGQFAKLFAQLGGSSGPLSVFIATLGTLAEGLSWLLENVPGLQQLVVALAAMAAISKAMQFGAAITGIQSMVTALWGLKAAQEGTTLAAVRARLATIASTAAHGVATAATYVLATAQRVLASSTLLAVAPWALLVAAVAIAAYLIIKHWDEVKKFLETIWNAIKTAASAAWNAIKSVVVGAAQAIKDLALAYFNAYKTALEAIWNAIKTATSAAWNAIKSVVTGAANAIKDAALAIFNAYRSALSAIWSGIRAAASAAWNAIEAVIVGPARAAVSFVRDAFSGLVGILSGVWGRIRSSVANAWGGIKDAIGGAVQGAVDFVTGLGRSFYNAGANLVKSLADGIVHAAEAVYNAIKSMAQKARNLLPGSEPKDRSSPFYGLKRSGEAILENLADGLASGAVTLERQLAVSLTPAAAMAATPARMAAAGPSVTNNFGGINVPPAVAGAQPDPGHTAALLDQELRRRGAQLTRAN